MAVLGLNRVELISQSEVVLVTLLNFEDFSLELGNEQVLLITCEVNTVVVLQ